MTDSLLQDLERAMDEATLTFWEALMQRDTACAVYQIAEQTMFATKAAYLREKLGRNSEAKCQTE